MISGDWCASYLQRLENKYLKQKITEEKYRYVEEHLKIHSCKEELDKIIEEVESENKE